MSDLQCIGMGSASAGTSNDSTSHSHLKIASPLVNPTGHTSNDSDSSQFIVVHCNCDFENHDCRYSTYNKIGWSRWI